MCVTDLVFLALLGHDERMVGQFVRLGLQWLHLERVRPGPKLAVDHRTQVPVLVGPVHHREVACLALAYVCREMLRVACGRNADTHAGQGQLQWLRSLDLTLQILKCKGM